MRTSRFLTAAVWFAALPALVFAQASPSADTSVTIAGKAITIKYSSPSVRGRKIFGDDGLISHDQNYPVWRAGANAATLLDTAGELTIGSLKVPAGKYTLFVLLDKAGWQLIVNKQTGQSGLDYDAKQDLGRVKMTMGKPPALVEKYKMTLAAAGGNKGKLTLEWENVTASVDFTVK
jgi:hypothetical protein